jgi:hypothetical protein
MPPVPSIEGRDRRSSSTIVKSKAGELYSEATFEGDGDEVDDSEW